MNADEILAECREQALADGFSEPHEIMAYTAGRLAQRLALYGHVKEELVKVTEERSFYREKCMQMQISDLRREVTA